MPLAEHDEVNPCAPTGKVVSIHVPLAEHDRATAAGATQYLVSIHVPLAEHDVCILLLLYRLFCFNSRAPRGARLMEGATIESCIPFQFTCPSRSTTRPFHQMPGQYSFNSRAPRGARPSILTSAPVVRMFQFTCPSRSTTAPLGD